MSVFCKIVVGGLVVLAVAAVSMAASHPAAIPGVIVENGIAPDDRDAPLPIRVWRPATLDRKYPLIVISHSTSGSISGHADTATALARAGFIVVALEHTGDNARDASHVRDGSHLGERPRHISRTIDYMLGQWPGRWAIDPARIGMFGHSAGGFAALVIAGAEPDLSRGRAYCRERPEAWTCRYLRRNGYRIENLGQQRNTRWLHDPRVQAAVIAAPAIGYSFDKAALSKVRIPFQLWDAEHDAIVDDSGERIRSAMPVSPEYHRVRGAGHFSFLEPCTLRMRATIAVLAWFGTEAICTDAEGFDRARFHEEFNRSVVTYFKRALPHPARS